MNEEVAAIAQRAEGRLIANLQRRRLLKLLDREEVPAQNLFLPTFSQTTSSTGNHARWATVPATHRLEKVRPSGEEWKRRFVIREQHDAFTTRKVALWPVEQLPEQDNKGLVDLDALLNPLGHLGNVEAFSDERSLVYSTRGKDL